VALALAAVAYLALPALKAASDSLDQVPVYVTAALVCCARPACQVEDAVHEPMLPALSRARTLNL
jgi:hypothetical protein